MRISDALGSLALMATGADLALPYVVGAWLLAVSAMVAARVIRHLKELSK